MDTVSPCLQTYPLKCLWSELKINPNVIFRCGNGKKFKHCVLSKGTVERKPTLESQPLIDAIGEKGYIQRTRYGGINTEREFPVFHVTRINAEIAGLINNSPETQHYPDVSFGYEYRVESC